MNLNALVVQMGRTPSVLRALLLGMSDDDARRRPESGAWSILQIVNHLADEETEDFRTRVKMTLEDPTQAWPPIDPEAAVIARKFNERDLRESLERFAEARVDSIEWIRMLQDPNWGRTYHHPKLWDASAGDVMLSWAAHDHLHLRQIAKRLFELAQRKAPEYSSDYAGDW